MSQSRNRAVQAAIKAFVHAMYFDSPEVTYRVLVDHQTLLLSTEAEEYIEAYMHMDYVDYEFAKIQLQLGKPGANAPVPSLKAILQVPLELIGDARMHGVDPAWQRFVAKYLSKTGSAKQFDEHEVYEAIEELLRAFSNNANPLDAAYRVLVRRQTVLLSEAAIRHVVEQVDGAEASNDSRKARILKDVFLLLNDARKRGLPAAWKEFISAPGTQVASALTLFLTASFEPEEKRRVLEEQQHTLLSDEALNALRNDINACRRAGRTKEAALEEIHLHLLEDTQAKGISVALQNYLDALQTWLYDADDLPKLKIYESFVNASNLEQTWKTLVEHQQVLLTDETINWLRRLIATLEKRREIMHVTRCQKLLSLLQDARTKGIERAWDQYVRTLYQ